MPLRVILRLLSATLKRHIEPYIQGTLLASGILRPPGGRIALGLGIARVDADAADAIPCKPSC